MPKYPNTEQDLSLEDVRWSPDERLQGEIAPVKSLSGTRDASNGERDAGDAVGEMVAARLTSLLDGMVH